MKKFFTLIVLSLFIFLPLYTNAQEASIDVAIDTNPINPQPGENVLLTATSFGTDLSQSNIIWKYNGKIVARGVGKDKITVVAPNAGTTGVVSVSVNGSSLAIGSATIYLRPGSVDLLWEAIDSYTPPFYKGKALLPPGGAVRVTAIPSASAPKSLSYAWSRNGSAMQNSSGFNKSSIIFQEDSLNDREAIKVEIHSGSFNGSATSTINTVDPGLLVYQNNEGFINYAKGHDKSISVNGPGVILHFDPFYFSVPKSIGGDLKFDTYLNGEKINPIKQNEIGLSKPDFSTQSNIRVKVLTIIYSLQNIDKTFNILFQ